MGNIMTNVPDIRSCVASTLQARRFAVLATERDGQPHSSLVAFTAMDDLRELLFATYRNTRKFRNLAGNGKVSMFVDGRWTDRSGTGVQDGFVLTALGHAAEIPSTEAAAARLALLQRHPDLESFLAAPDCALVRVEVETYQVVGAIDDVRWWRPGAATAAS